MYGIPPNDWEAIDAYAQTNNLDILAITGVTDTNQYILHLDDRDEIVAIVNNSAEKVSDTSFKDIDEAARELAIFLGEQGHSNPVVTICHPENPDLEDWKKGCLHVWSDSDTNIPLTWRDYSVLHIKANLSIEHGCEDDDPADWWKDD